MNAIEILDYCTRFKSGNEYNDAIYFNDSIIHATIITTEIFKKALSETDKAVNMYCGKFSLFREETRNKISNLKLACDTTGLAEAHREGEWANFDPYTLLQTEITDFLNDNNRGRLNLIIERDFDSLKKCAVWKILKRGIENNRVRMFILHDNMGLGHFAVTEEAYRIENSDGEKTASGCFRDKINADILNDNFEFLMRISEPVSA